MTDFPPIRNTGRCNTTHVACDCVLERLRKLEAVARAAEEYVNLWSWNDIASKDVSKNAVMVSPWCNDELIPTQLRDAIAALREETK